MLHKVKKKKTFYFITFIHVLKVSLTCNLYFGKIYIKFRRRLSACLWYMHVIPAVWEAEVHEKF